MKHIFLLAIVTISALMIVMPPVVIPGGREDGAEVTATPTPSATPTP